MVGGGGLVASGLGGGPWGRVFVKGSEGAWDNAGQRHSTLVYEEMRRVCRKGALGETQPAVRICGSCG